MEDNKELIVSIDKIRDYYDKDEIYCSWYSCPSCEDTYVRSGDKYCSNCGCKFKWSADCDS
jgi:hypothetical protein